MKSDKCDKMIIAVLQDDDYREVIENLNSHGFYVTVLHSSGGFLKKANATIMMGLNHDDLDEALGVLREYGQRTEMEFAPTTSTMSMPIAPVAVSPVPIPVKCGGVVAFVLDVAQFERF